MVLVKYQLLSSILISLGERMMSYLFLLHFCPDKSDIFKFTLNYLFYISLVPFGNNQN